LGADSVLELLSVQKPSAELLDRFVTVQGTHGFSYSAVGASATTPPAGFVVDRTRIELGSGEAIFDAAKAALRRWEQFRLGWVEAWSPATPLEPGQVVAVVGKAMGLWWINSCRIIYTVDETGPRSQFGFAYGTLPSHVERGEERFLIEWDRATDRVFYDILAFSRPNHWLSRVGYPIVRLHQKRFGRESAASMFRAAGSPSPMPPVLQSTG
jgi:uncharacterized protein (UPF0548 family)